ncbi:hypothetical protein HIM_11558 [Hirsutella minnesotensis 3608]|uniref:Carrier domain-containing protein n=1 Tax=Hirsutella minnesotensis 3608 TaxID=1043627 RepID=A0A0F7ZWI8_9HYPO|nr:hypothetical protein HIM_11558 [Hirsutella minnesotensis 3608]
MRAYVFTGQSATLQTISPALLDQHQSIRRMFDDARDTFNVDFTKVNTHDEQWIRSNDTALTQPLAFLASMTAYLLLPPEPGPTLMTGHSLGEITSLAASGAVTIKAALELIKVRSIAMQDACAEHNGGMVAIMGLKEQQVQAACDSWNAQNEHTGSLIISHFNSPDQFVISGSKEGLEYACARLTSAERVVKLASPGAFHSAYMSKANDKFKRCVLAVEIQPPSCPIYQNSTACGSTDPAEIREQLLHHMVSPVRWTETIRNMVKDGTSEFILVGTEGGLQKLIKQIDPRINVSVSKTDQYLTMRRLVDMDSLRNSQRVGPQTPSELLLAELWAQILCVDPGDISARDSFYQLGGDSIAAMQMVSLVKGRGFVLSALDVMQNPVLRDQAAMMREVNQVSDGENAQDPYVPFSLLPLNAIDVETTRVQAAKACGLDVDQIQDMYPCTPLQRGLMAATAKDPSKYIARLVYEVGHTVESSLLLRACEATFRQLDILRTRIVDTLKAELVQVVSTETGPVTEWQHLEDYRASHKPSLGLGTALMRADMVHVSSDPRSRRIFILSAHHAVYDAWSLSLILDRLSSVYYGSSPPPVVACSRFAKYVRENLDAESARAFWKETLQDTEASVFPSVPKAPYSPSSHQTFSHRIADVACLRGGDIMLSTVLTTAWATVASRYSGSEQVVFGMVSSGRQAAMPGIESVIGPTITTVPVCVQLPDTEALSSVLQRAQATCLAMIPFEQTGIQTIRNYSPELERICHFQTLLVLHPPQKANKHHDSLLVRANREDSLIKSLTHAIGDFGTQALAIQVFLQEKKGCLLEITHDPSVLNGDSARRLARQFESVVHQIISSLRAKTSHQLPMGRLSLDNDRDTCQIWQWNAVAPPLIKGCVHDMVSEAAAKYHYKTALCSWEGELTHRQLDNMSTRLAHHLVHLGLSPGDIVPLCFEKSIWTVVAIMGIMKAGAASVAMDVGQPVQRLRQIVNKVDPRLILCSVNATDLATELVESCPSRQALSVSANLLITLSSTPPKSPSELPIIDPSRPLYVVFTSGSTGAPKGAVISHANFCSAIRHQREAMRYGPGSRVFDFVSYAFDVTWPNILQTLTAGGCVCVPSEDERRNDISAAIRRLGATAIHVPTSVARLIDPAEVPAIELVVLGGEPVALSDVTRWGAGVEVVQVYGPAECTPPVMVSYNVSSGDSMKNIGRGYGVVPWIVDVSDCQKLAPIGVVGELVLEGPLVGLGYLGEPEKTTVAFLQDPVWLARGCPGRPGRSGRVYRTGDLARYDADGCVIFIGRKDAQVKVHGQRIELGDVEVHVGNILQGQPRQVEVLVDAVTPKNSTTTVLVAFMVVAGGYSSLDDRGQTHTAASLRDISTLLKQGLLERLPAYMVPTAYISIEKVPVTGTGKKDRRRLREMGAGMTLEELTWYNPDRQDKRQPETKWERRLLLMASEILAIRVESIGADDSFVQIGGDSIAAMRLVALARNRYRATLTVSEIYKHPRLSVLARLAESRIASSNGHGDE